mmetsp:Transcript_106484/g.333919  ORF Transcript_106484/g.333919 Transcript_106484/m.333919 type:complete len:346 (-) Transcript_106484:81-1118(-)
MQELRSRSPLKASGTGACVLAGRQDRGMALRRWAVLTLLVGWLRCADARCGERGSSEGCSGNGVCSADPNPDFSDPFFDSCVCHACWTGLSLGASFAPPSSPESPHAWHQLRDEHVQGFRPASGHLPADLLLLRRSARLRRLDGPPALPPAGSCRGCRATAGLGSPVSWSAVAAGAAAGPARHRCSIPGNAEVPSADGCAAPGPRPAGTCVCGCRGDGAFSLIDRGRIQLPNGCGATARCCYAGCSCCTDGHSVRPSEVQRACARGCGPWGEAFLQDAQRPGGHDHSARGRGGRRSPGGRAALLGGRWEDHGATGGGGWVWFGVPRSAWAVRAAACAMAVLWGRF